MKRIHTTMMIGLLAVVVMVTGCKREYGTVTLGAQIDEGRDAKVYIDGLTPCWHNNDLIRVNNQTCTTSAALGSSAQITDVVESNHYRAIYPADIVGDVNISSSTVAVTLPREQQYEVDSRGDQKVKVPMGAFSSNESLTFHNLCSLIKVVVSNKTDEDFLLDCITVTANSAYLSGSGNGTVSGNSNDVISLTASSSNHDVSLVFPAANRPTIGRGDRDTYVYYIVAPEFAEDDVTIALYSQGQCATFEKRASLQHNRMAQVNLIVEQWEEVVPPSLEGSLSGLFSVSATKQVYFSQGNLQYQASTNTWRFAEHQWSKVGTDGWGNVLGSDNCNISPTYSGWIDLFGWGTSGWNSGANCYQPWSTSQDSNDYYPGGSHTNGLIDDYVEADWAYHNAISNGGNAAHLWRTLTYSEWYYLFNTRANAWQKFGTGFIWLPQGVSQRANAVFGLIILPDDWTLPSGCSFDYSMYSEDWIDNEYTMAQWAQMEAAGAVFLPSNYYRVGTSVYADDDTYYWSSTPYGYYRPHLTNIYGYTQVYVLRFVGDMLNFSMAWRYYGLPVRAVRDNNVE